jgi:hypothetical protein
VPLCARGGVGDGWVLWWQPFLKLPLVICNPVREGFVGWEKPEKWVPKVMECLVANFVPAYEVDVRIDQPEVPKDLFGSPETK